MPKRLLNEINTSSKLVARSSDERKPSSHRGIRKNKFPRAAKSEKTNYSVNNGMSVDAIDVVEESSTAKRRSQNAEINESASSEAGPILIESTNDSNKDMLLTMFLGNCEGTKEDLERNDHVKAFKSLLGDKGEASKLENKKISSENPLPTNFPEALSVFRQQSKTENNILETVRKRSRFAATELQELEQKVAVEFQKSKLQEQKPKSTEKVDSKVEDPTAQESKINEKKAEAVIPPLNPEKFRPFSLLYNECSVATICKWAGQKMGQNMSHSPDTSSNDRPVQTNNPVYIPTVSSAFRKCSICNLWGHYEIECDKMNSDQILSMGRELKIQLKIREIVEGGRSRLNPTTLPSHLNGQKEFSSRRCQICCTTFAPDTMISCAGCDLYWHFQCLDLEVPPSVEWFCNECINYNCDISSTVEIDECDGFIIEQKKRPQNDDGKLESENVVSDESDDTGSGEHLSPAGYESERSIEETRMDQFVIKARRSEDEVPIEEVAVGSVVAWFPHNDVQQDYLNGGKISSEEEKRTSLLSMVLEMDCVNGKCLVQEVSYIADDSTSDSIAIVPLEKVHWLPKSQLHVVGSSVSTSDGTTILEEAKNMVFSPECRA